MQRKTVFDLFLILSIVFILLGVATIIFIQIDRGYVVSNAQTDTEFEAQQNRLLEYLYQSTRHQTKDVVTNPDKQISTFASSQSAKLAPQQVLTRDENYEHYLLNQNPWSPNFRPSQP